MQTSSSILSFAGSASGSLLRSVSGAMGEGVRGLGWGEGREVVFHIPSSATFPSSLAHHRPSRLFSAWNISNSSLGSLNPELYKNPEEGDLLEYPEGHIGRLWFTVEYEREEERVTVVVGKARNLLSRDLNSQTACDPFIRVFLLPDERRHVQTKVKRKTVNPNYNETFTFDASTDTFEERTLKFVAFDIDPLQRYIPLGAVNYSLKDYTRIKKMRLTTWRDLKKDESEVTCQLGELHCGLCYIPSMERLTATIIEAKDLRPPDDAHDLDTFCKVTLAVSNKQVKSKKTRILKRNVCPVYNESFTFKVPQDKMEQVCLSIQVMQLKPERQIGRVTLAGAMYARGKSLEHWTDMMAQPKEQLQEWHYLGE